MSRPRSLRTRTAVAGAVGFFLLAGLLMLAIGLLVQQRIGSGPDDFAERIVSELGLEADGIDDLTISDPNGTTVGAGETAPLLEAVADATRRDVARIFWFVIPALAIVAGAVAWWLAGRATRPIVEMTKLAEQVSAERLDARIRYDGPEGELRALADEFDVMMERLEHAFTAQRQFAAAASHELRTPLTVIRTELDVALDAPDPSRDELDSMAEGIRTAIQRSERVIDGLLVLARSGVIELTATRDLGAVIDRAIEDLGPTIAARRITVGRAADHEAVVRCDPVLLDRMVDNLIDNAVRHNLDEGWVEVGVDRSGDEVVLSVANSGPALEEEVVARLGEPFYRGPSGERRIPGTGLGVAIARSIAEAHGGSLGLQAREAGGLVVTVRLPAAWTRSVEG